MLDRADSWVSKKSGLEALLPSEPVFLESGVGHSTVSLKQTNRLPQVHK